MRLVGVLATALCMLAPERSPAADDAAASQLHWYRCNTHTHTSARPNSDANGTPDSVVRWYKEHGYQCLVITDHEYLTDVAPLNRDYGKDSRFLVIRGQEITQIIRDPSHPHGLRHGHVNGINIDRVIMPVGYPEHPEGVPLAEVYRRNIAAVRDAGGIPQINHPNLHWSVRLDDLLALSGPYLIEVWNAFPSSNNLGGPDENGTPAPSTDGLWDALLSRGKVVWGVASDDVHEYVRLDDREAPTPGKGWVVLQAPSLSLPEVMTALRKGRFYASTGIELESYHVDARRISMVIAGRNSWNSDLKLLTRYTTRFIGADGKVLAEAAGTSPTYEFKGDEQYVRAAILDSDGRRAWTQPVFRDGRRDAVQ